ncbi:ultraviolet-B receptor UVR8 [Bradysia coprophila]|uniref:ultraviolet-B receptor UVR8 n=1 Tax=Bradysia coprophila TaxID=38358 RepID=UPI00187D9763|nr:ultraviolet-B receptor UVR8 [Bradysia coprophila]
MIYFCGYNGFNQFKNCNELMVANMTEWKFDDTCDIQETTSIKFCSSWSVNVLALSNELLLSGCLKGIFGSIQKFTMPDNIKAVSCNDSFCLILLINGICCKISFDTLELRELNFIGVDESISSEENLPSKKQSTEVIEHIACGDTLSVAMTSANVVYNIPTRIFQFPKHVKVKKLSCGAEHALILTTNGDVYAWGSSSRGQLGLGQLDSEVAPTLIDGLAGVKITDISCGLWHSAAVSAFGDLYMWGWNLNGQLGKPVYKDVTINYQNGRTDMIRHKDVSVFASPEIVDLPKVTNSDDENDDNDYSLDHQLFVERVHCGSRHTVIETECNQMFGCGFNRYGQLGVNVEHNVDQNIVQFVGISHNVVKPFDVKCGSWCTILISGERNKI